MFMILLFRPSEVPLVIRCRQQVTVFSRCSLRVWASFSIGSML